MSMTQQTVQAVQEADLVFFIIDGKVGATFEDEHFAKWLRKQIRASGRNISVHLVANKCEGNVDEYEIMEAAKLGFGNPLQISAYHNMGVSELFGIIDEKLPEIKEVFIFCPATLFT